MTNLPLRVYREGIVLILLGCLAMAGSVFGHPDKFDRDQRVGFAAMIPERLGEWNQISVKSSDTPTDQLDVNEIHQVLYSHPSLGLVALTLEYTSDSRREFELHYPDVCHSVRGDEVVVYPPDRFELSDGRFIEAAIMNWQQRNGGHKAVTAYWYVTPEGITTDTMKLKINQALSGLLSRPEAAVMVRFDAFYEQKLDPQKRTELIDAIKALSQNIENVIDERSNTILYKNFDRENI